MPSDFRRLLLSKAARNFGYGLLGVVLGLYLSSEGYSPGQVGALLTTALVGSALLTAVIAVRGDQWGRQRTLTVSAALMAMGGLAFGLAQPGWVLVLAALTGTLSPTSGEVGPFETLESAILPQLTTPERRNRVFGLYNAAGAAAVALGSLAAALPEVASLNLDLPLQIAYRSVFLVYAALGLIALAALSGLSSQVELHSRTTASKLFRLHQSRRPIHRLAGLFALDSFAGGFVIQSFLAYWFSLRFGVGGEVLGPVFFAVSIMKTLSYLAAVRLADRIGLLNTMVFSHLPSNLLLMLIPFLPTLSLAIAVLVLRHALSQMDVPTRASYIVAIVEPDERTAATGLTNLVRTAAHGLGPVLSGIGLQYAGFGFPFFVGGGLKVVYDLLLYRSFRRVVPEGEAETGTVHDSPD